MAKKANVNTMKDGDMSNLIVLRSAHGKAGQKYTIQPQKDPTTGMYPKCVRRVNALGDMILLKGDDELDPESLIPETMDITIMDGKVFDLSNTRQAAQWEAIRHCFLIAPDRYAKDAAGNYLIDGSTDINQIKTGSYNPGSTTYGTSSKYGIAELYIERPGMEAKKRLTKRKLKLQAQNFIEGDSAGYEGWLRMAKVLGRNMQNQPAPDVEEFLFSIAEQTPEKIIELYTGGDLQLRLLLVTAKEKGVIRKKNNLYFYGEDQNVILGASEDAVLEWMKSPRNAKTLELIRKDTYPEMYGED